MDRLNGVAIRSTDSIAASRRPALPYSDADDVRFAQDPKFFSDAMGSDTRSAIRAQIAGTSPLIDQGVGYSFFPTTWRYGKKPEKTSTLKKRA